MNTNTTCKFSAFSYRVSLFNLKIIHKYLTNNLLILIATTHMNHKKAMQTENAYVYNKT